MGCDLNAVRKIDFIGWSGGGGGILFDIVIMVKNTSGGSKTKSFARKLQHEVPSVSLRIPQNEFEVVGCVFKMLGNGRMVVRTALAGLTEIQCVIRNKFRGRAKRNHMVSVGTFVLIGLYDWESPNFKSSDLLHVYTPENVLALKSVPSLSLGGLDAFVSQYTGAGAGGSDDFTFSHDAGVADEDGGDDGSGSGVSDAEGKSGMGCGSSKRMTDFDFDAI